MVECALGMREDLGLFLIPPDLPESNITKALRCLPHPYARIYEKLRGWGQDASHIYYSYLSLKQSRRPRKSVVLFSLH